MSDKVESKITDLTPEQIKIIQDIEFSSVHNHTTSSNIRLLDCINKPEELIDRAIELDYSAVAITDHEILAALPESLWYVDKLKKEKKCPESFKFILGNEAYVVNSLEKTKENYKAYKNGFYHLVLLAKDYEGYEQLKVLSTAAWENSYTSKRMTRVPLEKSTLYKVVSQNKGHLICSSACFERGTKVLTKDGYKDIDTIKPGEFVFSHTGWEEVVSPTNRLYTGNLITINGTHGFEEPITATETHKFFALQRKHNTNIRNYGTVNSDFINSNIQNFKELSNSKKQKYWNHIRNVEPDWIELKDLEKGDFIFSKVDTKIIDLEYFYIKSKDNSKYKINNKIKIDNDFCELFGIWLAEGSWDYTNNNKRISFSINKKEEFTLGKRIIDLMSSVFNINNPYIYRQKDSEEMNICYTSVELSEFFKSLYENDLKINQWTKYIPKKLKYIKPEKQLQIYKGWMMGDGYFRSRGAKSFEAVGATVSKQLALDLKFILYRNYINPSFEICKKHGIHKESYYLYITGSSAKEYNDSVVNNTPLTFSFEGRSGKDLPCFINGEPFLKHTIKEKKVKPVVKYPVFCLNVKNSHSFSVSSVIVHNCLGNELSRILLQRNAYAQDIRKYKKILQDKSKLTKLSLENFSNEYEEAVKNYNSIQEDLEEYFNFYLNLFKDDFYLELQPSNQPDQVYVNKELIKLGKKLNIKWIITTDSHYKSLADRKVHKAYLNSKDGEREVDDFYATTYLMEKEIIISYLINNQITFEDAVLALSNTKEIYDKCQYYTLEKGYQIPKINVSQKLSKLKNDEDILNLISNINLDEYGSIKEFLLTNNEQDCYYVYSSLKGLIDKEIKEKGKSSIKVYIDDKDNLLKPLPTVKYSLNDALKRINSECEELFEISKELKANLSQYYISMQQIIDLVWTDGDSFVGPGRGSVGCWYTAYLMDITDTNAMEWNLPQWRHVDRSKIELSDVDFDTQSLKRQQILRSVKNYFGCDKVLNICTYGKEGSKSAIITSCRSLGLDPDVGIYLSSLIPIDRGFPRSLKECYEGNEEKDYIPVTELINQVAKYPGLKELAMGIESLVNKRG